MENRDEKGRKELDELLEGPVSDRRRVAAIAAAVGGEVVGSKR